MFLRVIYATVFVLVCLVAYQAFSMYSARKSAENVPQYTLLGPEDADLTVVMFFDYMCPYCKEIYPKVIGAMREDGNVNIALRYLPAFGEESKRQARLAYAAGLQDKFPELHEYLVTRRGGDLSPEALRNFAARNDIDLEKLLNDAESEEIKAHNRESLELAAKLGVYSTPSFLAGTVLYSPTERMPNVQDLLALFAEARGEAPKS